MSVTKLISSREAVEKFYIDTRSQNFITDDEAKLWTAEIFDFIKYPLQYIPKVTGHKQDPAYEFTDYKVPLPCDFRAFIPGGIAVNGNPVRWRSNSFHYLMDGDCCDMENLNGQIMDLFQDQFGNEFSPQSTVDPNTPAILQDITFDVYNECIQFNIKEGKVCLAYYAYPLDNEGFVMIPDEAKFKRAVTDYLTWKHDYIQWRQGALPDAVYRESVNNKNWAIASAASELKIPDDFQMDSIKDSIVRLIPRFNGRTHFYKTLGVQEQRRFR
jgi:hypothetical protein